jgi:CRP/FNR family cyclic AMP-dependent transcriptional regulator
MEAYGGGQADPRARRGRELVRVFDQDPDLLGALARNAQSELRRDVVVPLIRLDRGEWRPPVVRLPKAALGALVLDGLILRRIDLRDRTAVEIVGPGDVLRPWDSEELSDALPVRANVKVCTTANLAVLDAEFVTAAASWPPVLAALADRMSRRTTALVHVMAIAQLPGVETRLWHLFWHLADRWGRVGPKGVTLPLRLSQQTLADLTASRRPSVNTALRVLVGEGRLERLDHFRGYRLIGPRPVEVPEPRRSLFAG